MRADPMEKQLRERKARVPDNRDLRRETILTEQTLSLALNAVSAT